MRPAVDQPLASAVAICPAPRKPTASGNARSPAMRTARTRRGEKEIISRRQECECISPACPAFPLRVSRKESTTTTLAAEPRMSPLLLSLALLAPTQSPVDSKANDAGVLPVGADGKPLNLDFETGTLKDWTAEGSAFAGQPIKGDTVKPRRADMQSRHQGQFWIGSYEKAGDKPTGTLTSIPFKVTHKWASFLIGGGSHNEETCVELFHAEKRYVIHRATGQDEEDLRRELVDLSGWVGHELQIRLVDRHSGGWGHINF